MAIINLKRTAQWSSESFLRDNSFGYAQIGEIAQESYTLKRGRIHTCGKTHMLYLHLNQYL